MKTLGVLLCAASVAAGACTIRDATGPDAVAPVAGSWRYSSSQVAPSPAETNGTLSLSVAPDGSIVGTAAVVERVPGTVDLALAGQISGLALDTLTVEFTLTLAAVAREHLGVLRGDSLTGTWVVTDGAAAGTSGRFTAVRTGP